MLLPKVNYISIQIWCKSIAISAGLLNRHINKPPVALRANQDICQYNKRSDHRLSNRFNIS